MLKLFCWVKMIDREFSFCTSEVWCFTLMFESSVSYAFATRYCICIYGEKECHLVCARYQYIMNQCWSADWPLECTTTAWWGERKKSNCSLSPREHLPSSTVWMTTTERGERPTGHLIILFRILLISKKIGWCVHVHVHIQQRCVFAL